MYVIDIFLGKIRQYLQAPKYSTMRIFARFPLIRELVCSYKTWSDRYRFKMYIDSKEQSLKKSMFKNIDKDLFLKNLKESGVSFGLTLPTDLCERIREWSNCNPCFADRNPSLGFHHEKRLKAENILDKPILVAQYFNTINCDSIRAVVSDPFFEWIAAKYFKFIPKFVGTNLWWTFPVIPTDFDKRNHAHLYHSDIDDFKFLKFFFYITDVSDGDGAHICVRGSISNPPSVGKSEYLLVRRYSDMEIETYYHPSDIIEVRGDVGSGFAEDTLCVHKGTTPTKKPRLILQLEYAMFDYNVSNDERELSNISMLEL